jgi:DNA polymerase, archaea type
MADGSGAYNRYFGRLDTGKMKIRGVMARKVDTPEYVRRMQHELFEVLAQARSKEELRIVELEAQEVRERYMMGLKDADVRELAIPRRLNYSRRCVEASAVKAYRKRGLSLVPGMEIGCVVKDAKKWILKEMLPSLMLSIIGSCREKTWDEVAFVLLRDFHNGLHLQ